MTEPPAKEDLVTLTIDGFEIAVPPGTLLIRAAEQLGIPIPRFCDHPLLDPIAACRQCLVEVSDMGNGRGMPKPPPACATTVMPGMVVKTQFSSPTADKAQQGQMEFLLINHPLDCPVCDKGGECPLQNQAMTNGRSDTRFRDMKRTWPKPITVNPNILLDRERCISCTRCFRFAEQIAGDPMLVMAERGWQQDIDTAVDEPFESYFSGNTIQICPVGALTSVSYRFRSRPFDLRSADSICEHCASGCALRTDFRRGKVTRRLAGEDNEVNEEWNCDKGRFAFTYATQDDRLVTPMVRDGRGQLVETTWPEALERAAEGLRAAVQNGGVGVLPGGRLTEEDAYAYAKFARVVLATNDIDCRARPGSNEELDFLAAHVAGTTPQQLSYSALEYAPTVLLVGFEAEEESPIVFLRLRKGTRLGRTKVYSIASLASNGLNKLGGILLPTRPGDEAAAIVDLPVVVRDALCLHGGVILAGERLASSPGAFSAVAALAADTGASLAWLPRRAGERGAVDAGALPNLLPGARPVVDPAARREVAAVWGVEIPARPGRDLDEILAAAGNRSLSGLVIGGLDPADLADPSGALDALASVGFVVSLELRHSAVTERADVVLPVAAAAEKSGRYVDWEGRRRSFDHFLESAAISDARTLDMLADEMDVNLGLRTLAATRDELARLGAWTDRPATPSTTPRPSPRPGIGELLLATWAEVLDAGRMQDGEPFLAATAKPARAVLASATATELGITNGDMVTVGTPGRSVVLPVELGGVLEGVIWLPTNAPGCAVRTVLRAAHGAVVRVARSTSLPVVGADPLAASGGQP